MGTIRVAVRERGWLIVDSRTVGDSRLSYRARGVLLWLLDKPDDWTVNSDAIANHGLEGREAVRTCLRELETAGYLVRVRNQDALTGRWMWEQVVYEYPDAASAAHGPGIRLRVSGARKTADGKSGLLVTTKTQDSKSSSSPFATRVAPNATDSDDDDRAGVVDERINQAARIEAIARLDRRRAAEDSGRPVNPIDDAEAWLAKTASNWLVSFHATAAELANANPDATPDELLELVKASTAPPHRPPASGTRAATTACTAGCVDGWTTDELGEVIVPVEPCPSCRQIATTA